jgi:hypothetical protein
MWSLSLVTLALLGDPRLGLQNKGIAWRTRDRPGQEVVFQFTVAEFHGHSGIELSGSGRDRTFALEADRLLVIRTLDLGWESPVLLFLESAPSAPERNAAPLRSLRAWERIPLGQHLVFGEPIDGSTGLVPGTEGFRELQLREGVLGEIGCDVSVWESVKAADQAQSVLVTRSWKASTIDGLLCAPSGSRLLSLKDRILYDPSGGQVQRREREYAFVRSAPPDYYIRDRINIEETGHEELSSDAFDQEGQLLFDAWCLSRPDPAQALERLGEWEALPKVRLADVAVLVRDLIRRGQEQRHLLEKNWRERLLPASASDRELAPDDLDAAFQYGLVSAIVIHAGLDDRRLEQALELDLGECSETAKSALTLAFRLARDSLSGELQKATFDERQIMEARSLLEETSTR